MPRPAPKVLAEVARLNRLSQAHAVEALVTLRLGCRHPIPGETALLTLHRTGLAFLAFDAGRYRMIEVHVARQGEVMFQAPPWGEVPARMRAFFRGLPAVWAGGDALDVAAHVLWSITRIHPFRDGNGRAAAAFAYACLCLKLGAVLPGGPTVAELVIEEHAATAAALRAADATDGADLSELKRMLDGLLLRQVQAAQAA